MNRDTAPAALVTDVNLVELLETCLVAALASQKYVLQDMLRVEAVLGAAEEGDVSDKSVVTPTTFTSGPRIALTAEQQRRLTQSFHDSLDIESKGTLSHRATNATDLVTSADKIVQRVVTALLVKKYGMLSQMPFTVIGEEDDENEESALLNDDAVSKVFTYANDLHARIVSPAGDPSEDPIPHWRAATSLEAPHIHSASLRQSQERILVFVDPIDGTNAFVSGHLEVPMTLIGIAIDGVPVAGVVNRIFQTTAVGESCPASLSYAMCSSEWKSRFVVLNGVRIPSSTSAANNSNQTFDVTYSASTKPEIMQPFLDRLSPRDDRPALGAGNKLMMVAARAAQPIFDSALDLSAVVTDRDLSSADAFVTPNNAIKKWDTCAVHAILLALGGLAFSAFGEEIVYRPVYSDPITLDKKATTELPTGFVAAKNAEILAEIRQRLGW